MKTKQSSALTRSDYEKIYHMLDAVSPIDTDCGKLCRAVCCSQEDAGEDAGIYLLPGEASVHDKSDPWLTWWSDSVDDYDFPASWTGTVDFVRCRGAASCRRSLRPIQCRTFPLAVHLTPDGKLQMILNDMELPYRCPLIENGRPLNADFVRVTLEAWQLLITDPLIRDLVEEDSRARDADGHEYTVLFPAQNA